MNDLFPDELSLWQLVEKKTRDVFTRYGFSEIRTPILEDLSLFVRGVGEGTDIVEKEMYVLKDRDESLLCLRPENTAGVVRALIEHKTLVQESEFKTYYIGPMFRRERPQKGRLRQFHQIGAEVFGISEPSADVELISMVHQVLNDLGINELTLQLNSLGEASERKVYVAKLVEYYESRQNELCEDCKKRLHKNPLRLLDCKNPNCIEISKAAPELISFLEKESREHFDAVQEGLTSLNIPFHLSTRLVRGLDYYTRTVFELSATSGLGAQNAVAAGGRYDALVENLGGPKVPAVGFSAGIERILILLNEKGVAASKPTPDLSFICMDKAGRELALLTCAGLRKQGIFAEFDHKERSVKAQMRRADKMSAKSIIVLGERERNEKMGQLKNLSSGETQPISLDVETIVRVLKTTAS